jgi:hypothetical protein
MKTMDGNWWICEELPELLITNIMGGLWLWLAHLHQMDLGLCDFAMSISRSTRLWNTGTNNG